MGKNDKVMEYVDILQRIYTLLVQIKNVAEELETNDLNLVAHLLILDCLHYGRKKHFKGIDDPKAKGKEKQK